MSLLVRFTPFAAFLLLSAAADWRAGLVAGLLGEIVVITTVDHPIHVGVLDGAMLVFFGAMTAVAFVRPDSALQDHVGTIAMTWLALVALVSAAVRRPFTADLARRHVSPDVARSVEFVRTNQIITLVWAACFAGSAVAGAVLRAADRPVLGRLAGIGLIVVAVRFSTTYPQRARDHVGAAQPASSH